MGREGLNKPIFPGNMSQLRGGPCDITFSFPISILAQELIKYGSQAAAQGSAMHPPLHFYVVFQGGSILF